MHPAKATIVEDLQAKLNSSPFLFIADYTGLKVSQFAELRNRLWNAGARCHVVKNTFLRRAAKEAGLPEIEGLKGQTAIIVGEKDVAAAAKILKNFTAEFKKPEVKSGVVDRLVVTTEQIKTIADLPSREVLLATLLGVFNAPASKLVRVLNEPASALARVLQAKADKEGPAAPAEAAPAESAPAPAESSAPAPAESSAPAPAESSASAPAESSASAPAESSAPAPAESSAPAPAESSAPAPAESSAPAQKAAPAEAPASPTEPPAA
jgi:large subunit ribosomal protein L10